ncbi:MalM family protein [Photobacterium sp. CCB-ST2H9]|uniref:MalM family protein n=1 Tax=Photobacterium sp. CCB-ST2H9 TaxID=2912855 RepID=UPI002003DDA0|nr:MalM family protein [Photobacterium sp. CCB-ST2H9]UTM59740.1 MalM family protein [Photobacterium sp. CCB-ST2H9]
MRILSYLFLVMTLSACSLTDSFSPDTVNGVTNISVSQARQDRDQLATAKRYFTEVRNLPSLPCCDELPVLFRLTHEDVIIELSSGRSFTKLIKLSPAISRQDLLLTSLVSQTVFPPQVQLYSEDFLLIDSLTAYRYQPFSVEEPDRLELEIPLSRYSTPVRYLLVYTSSKAMRDYTPLLDAEAQYESRIGMDVTPHPWFLAPHAPTGSLILRRR